MDTLPREGLSTLALRAGLNMLAVAFHNTGQTERWIGAVQEIERFAEKTRQPHFEMLAQTYRAVRLLNAGLLEEAVAVDAEATARAMAMGLPGYAQSISGPMSRGLYYLGKTDELANSGVDSMRILGLALRQDAEGVRALAGTMPKEPARRGAKLSIQRALIAIRDEDMARLLVDENSTTTNLMDLFRLRAESAIILGQTQRARRGYEAAVEHYERTQERPELALTRLGLAELLLDHYPEEHEAAIEHLDFAIAELRDMKMQPALERALGRRGLLKA
jgi:tetratricopeptide (TPR) repeat protein